MAAKHEHHQHDHCEHERVKYCRDCREVYCLGCKETFKTSTEYWRGHRCSPWQPYGHLALQSNQGTSQMQNISPYAIGNLGVSTETVPLNTITCTHDDVITVS